MKKGLISLLREVNVDDTYEFRPGRKALEELGIATPLLEANLTKEEIRLLSKQLGLSTWNKPSMRVY